MREGGGMRGGERGGLVFCAELAGRRGGGGHWRGVSFVYREREVRLECEVRG